jgi:hypothetical protein
MYSEVKDESINTSKMSFNSGSFSFRNKLINGGFDVWQRGETLTTSNTQTPSYIADRWGFVSGLDLANTMTVSREVLPIGQTTIATNPTNSLRVTFTTGATEKARVFQRIENVKLLANKTVTLGFWTKATAAFAMDTSIRLNFGPTPTFSAEQIVDTTSISVGTSWTRQEISFAIPSIAGKTVAADNITYTEVCFEFPISTTSIVEFAHVQLEEGPTATPFEPSPIELTTLRCLRYFEKCSTILHNVTGSTNANWKIPFSYKTPKRTSAPAFVNSTLSGGSGASLAAPFASNITANNCLVALQVISNAVEEYYVEWNIDAEL